MPVRQAASPKPAGESSSLRGLRLPSLRISLIRRRDARAGRELDALRCQALLQGTQEQQYDIGPAVVTHQAHAPHLALPLTQGPADFDAKFVQQILPRLHVVRTGGDAQGIEL